MPTPTRDDVMAAFDAFDAAVALEAQMQVEKAQTAQALAVATQQDAAKAQEAAQAGQARRDRAQDAAQLVRDYLGLSVAPTLAALGALRPGSTLRV